MTWDLGLGSKIRSETAYLVLYLDQVSSLAQFELGAKLIG